MDFLPNKRESPRHKTQASYTPTPKGETDWGNLRMNIAANNNA